MIELGVMIWAFTHGHPVVGCLLLLCVLLD